jgi:hypothetical protein
MRVKDVAWLGAAAAAIVTAIWAATTSLNDKPFAKRAGFTIVGE